MYNISSHEKIIHTKLFFSCLSFFLCCVSYIEVSKMVNICDCMKSITRKLCVHLSCIYLSPINKILNSIELNWIVCVHLSCYLPSINEELNWIVCVHLSCYLPLINKILELNWIVCVQACTLARRTAETFLKYVNRNLHFLGMQMKFRSPEGHVKGRNIVALKSFFSLFFLRFSIGGDAYVTVFNFFATWAATFRFQGYKCMLVIFVFP